MVLIFFVPSGRIDFASGGRAAAPFFSLLAQRKEGKRKGTLLTRPSASLRVLSTTARKELASFAGSNTFSLHP
jgi:hypothetical protein